MGRNAARERWLGYGRALAAGHPTRVRGYEAKGLPAPSPARVRAEFIAGSSAGVNAKRWLREGWARYEKESRLTPGL